MLEYDQFLRNWLDKHLSPIASDGDRSDIAMILVSLVDNENRTDFSADPQTMRDWLARNAVHDDWRIKDVGSGETMTIGEFLERHDRPDATPETSLDATP